jgi:hypothetical protein
MLERNFYNGLTFITYSNVIQCDEKQLVSDTNAGIQIS